jgi:cell division protein ZipA
LAAELRWILLGLSLPLLAGIWWWTARRAGRTPGDPALREPTAAKPAETPPPLDSRYIDSGDEGMKPEPAARDWGVPPFEPLNIRTADFDRVPVLDGPMMVNPHSEPLAVSAPVLAAVAPPAANVAELQRIVTIRVSAAGEARWSGPQLVAALELHGLAFGRYQVFHRNHVDGRSLFCVASLIEPGTFDIAGMADQEFRGVTLFAVLPGPIEPLETVDELFETARGLAEELSGMVQDAKGMPLSPQRAAAMREDVARFQALLPRN